jgi:hypothetical protein
MRYRPCSLRIAGMALALLGLALLAPGARAQGVPNFLYQIVKSSANPLFVMAANATSVLVRESGAGVDSLTVYPLDGSAPKTIASAGGPSPDGTPWAANAQFTQAAMNEGGDIIYREFAPLANNLWEIATVFRYGGTQQSVLLQARVSAPEAVKKAIDRRPDLNARYSVRNTTSADGSSTFIRWRDNITGATGDVVGTGDKIGTGGMADGDAIEEDGFPSWAGRRHYCQNAGGSAIVDRADEPCLDDRNNIVFRGMLRDVLVTNPPHSIVARLPWGAGGWNLTQSEVVRCPDNVELQQVSINKQNSDQTLVRAFSGVPKVPILLAAQFDRNPSVVVLPLPNPLFLPVELSNIQLVPSPNALVGILGRQPDGTLAIQDFGFVPGVNPSLVNVAQVFRDGQTWPMGTINLVLGGGFAANGNGSYLFTVSAGNNYGVAMAFAAPQPQQAVTGTAGADTLADFSGSKYTFSFSGTAGRVWSSVSQIQPSGAYVFNYTLPAGAFNLVYDEADATKNRLLLNPDPRLPSVGQVVTQPGGWGPFQESVSLNLVLGVMPPATSVWQFHNATHVWQGLASFSNPMAPSDFAAVGADLAPIFVTPDFNASMEHFRFSPNR